MTQAQVLEQVLEPLVRDDPLRAVLIENMLEEMGMVDAGDGEDAAAQHAARGGPPVGSTVSKDHVSVSLRILRIWSV